VAEELGEILYSKLSLPDEIAEMIGGALMYGRVCDPTCSSGGMFVRRFAEAMATASGTYLFSVRVQTHSARRT